MKIKLEEYKSVTVEDIMKVTNLPNPWSDQSKYSLARQKELLLKEAKKNNILHLVKKSHPIEYKVLTINQDKDCTILTAKVVGEPKSFTSVLDLNLVPHKVIRENGKVIIEVNKSDIPSHILPNPKPGYAYHVIGILAEEKCYIEGGIYSQKIDNELHNTRIGTKYRFGFHNKVSLHILD